MIAKQLISTDIIPLRCEDTGQKALNMMELYNVSHVPLVKEREYVGLISDKDVYDLNIETCSIKGSNLTLARPFAMENQHIYEVLGTLNLIDVSLLPVLDVNRNYYGSIVRNDLSKELIKLFGVDVHGAVIVLKMSPNDYSLSQISQIVESNDAKILSLFINHIHDTTELDVCLKLNVTDVTSTVETFVRYDYAIKAVYMDNSIVNDLYEDRYNQFIKFLNI